MQPKRDLLGNLFANKKLLFIVVGVVVLLVIVVSMLLFNTGSPTPAKLAALQSRVSRLAELVDSQGRSLSSASLRDQNANLAILLNGATGDLTKLTEGQDAKPDEKLVSSASSRLKKLEETLKQAAVTNTFDTAYQTNVVAEVASVEQQITSLLPEVGSSTRAALEDIRERLAKSREALAAVRL